MKKKQLYHLMQMYLVRESINLLSFIPILPLRETSHRPVSYTHLKQTIVTNGDQTDTIYEGMSNGKTFEESLLVREFEPDAPNYTPRISGILFDEEGNYSYKLSILKRDSETGVCQRFTYDYREPCLLYTSINYS